MSCQPRDRSTGAKLELRRRTTPRITLSVLQLLKFLGLLVLGLM